MKKRVLSITSIFLMLSFGFAAPTSSGSTISISNTSEDSNVAMDMMPVKKEASDTVTQSIDQPKQDHQLIGSSSATWTPAYLEVKDFEKCLKTQDYRGWQGYCTPAKQPKDCPKESWDKLQKMNLVPCH